MTVVHLLISCTSSMACWLHDPTVSMATGKKRCLFKSLILCSLVVCCLFGCRSVLSCSGAQMGLGESILNSDVPSHRFSLWSRVLELLYVWAFAITSEEAWWFLHSWDLSHFNGPPYDVVYLNAMLLSARAILSCYVTVLFI